MVAIPRWRGKIEAMTDDDSIRDSIRTPIMLISAFQFCGTQKWGPSGTCGKRRGGLTGLRGSRIEHRCLADRTRLGEGDLAIAYHFPRTDMQPTACVYGVCVNAGMRLACSSLDGRHDRLDVDKQASARHYCACSFSNSYAPCQRYLCLAYVNSQQYRALICSASLRTRTM